MKNLIKIHNEILGLLGESRKVLEAANISELRATYYGRVTVLETLEELVEGLMNDDLPLSLSEDGQGPESDPPPDPLEGIVKPGDTVMVIPQSLLSNLADLLEWLEEYQPDILYKSPCVFVAGRRGVWCEGYQESDTGAWICGNEDDCPLQWGLDSGIGELLSDLRKFI